jgi:DNA topoisomerase I
VTYCRFTPALAIPIAQLPSKSAGPQKKSDVPLDEKCPQCGNNLVLKNGRFGEFTACSTYPKCKFVKQKTIGVPCPNCSEGEVVDRRSKRGKTFYGCNRYPECNFVALGKPIQEKCPECGSPYLIEKWLKAGPVAQCPNGECKFKKPLEPVPASAWPESTNTRANQAG